MAYTSLFKLFYKNPEIYNEEYERRFNDAESVKLDIFIGDNQAFFCPDTDIYKKLVSIEKYDKKINELYNMLPGMAIAQFAKRCLIDEIVITNNIEGVHSTRREINDILSDLSFNNKRNHFAGLVKKYQTLMGNEIIDFNSCVDIRKIYDELFSEEIRQDNDKNLPDGKIFRKGSVSIVSPADKEIHSGLYPETKIIDTMERALKFLNNENIEEIFRISVFHYLFGYIHPFYDGNGRMSRFISSYLLSKSYNNLIAYRISYTIKENISKYYDAFKVCNHKNSKGDLTPFLEMFLGVIEISLSQLFDALQKRVINLEYYREAIKALPDGTEEEMYEMYWYLVQASLFSDNGISLEELQVCMEVTYNTLNNRKKRILPGLIEEKKFGRKKYFMLNIENVKKYLDAKN